VKPRALELFGGEGVAALGYAQAGYAVTLVENDPERLAHVVRHPDIVVEEGDATTWPLDGYDLVSGGPPCTDHTETAALAERTRKGGGPAGTGWMLTHTLQRVKAWAAAGPGRVYVIENVEGAKEHFECPLKLCGTMFDITDGPWSLQRHRFFESNAPLMAPGPCQHRGRKFIHVHGDLSVNDRACGGKRRPGGDMRAGVERARRLVGAPPETSPRGLSLCVPTAYTRWIGSQILAGIPYVARPAK
jgi:DNA (cytosine-5)-methyltransferase 1